MAKSLSSALSVLTDVPVVLVVDDVSVIDVDVVDVEVFSVFSVFVQAARNRAAAARMINA
jgi:hypothetical protein